MTENINPSELEESMHLSEYYYIVLRQKWTIIISLILTVSLILLYNFRVTPIYRATATLIIDKEKTRSPLTGERVEFETYMSESMTFNTHFKLVTSQPILEKVVSSMKLDRMVGQRNNQGFGLVNAIRQFFSSLKENILLLLGSNKEAPPYQVDETTRLVQMLKGMLEIKYIQDTRLFEINVFNSVPEMARDIANETASAYITFNVDNRIKTTRQSMDRLSDQLYDMKKKLEDAEADFLAYKQEVNIISPEESKRVIAQKITEFNDAYLQAQNRRLELNTKLDQLSKIVKSRKQLSRLRSLIENQLMNTLYAQMLDAEMDLSRLQKTFKSKHPKVTQARSHIEKIRRKLYEEIKKEIGNLQAEKAGLLAKEEGLQKAIADFENEGMEANKKEFRYTNFQRNVEMNQQLYDTLLSRIKETDITGNMDVSNLRVWEEAILPRFPVIPNKGRNLLLSVIFGLIFGVVISFLREYFDRTLRNEEDIRKHLGLTTLSVIPIAEEKVDASHHNIERKPSILNQKEVSSTQDQTKNTKSLMKKKVDKNSHRNLKQVFLGYYSDHSRFTESYRNLRTNIQFSLMGKGLRSILLASACEKEGKSTTAANLSYMFAQTGSTVLMLDADLRKPSLNRLFPSGDSCGITGLLSEGFATDITSGSISDFSFSDLFRLASFQKKTGVLSLTEGEEKVDLFFLEGEPVDVSWLTRPEEQRLAAVLVKNGLITNEQAQDAMFRQKRMGQKLGFILINMGLVQEESLAGFITLHMLDGLRTALQFKSGEFSFKNLHPFTFEQPSFNPSDLLQLYNRAISGGEELPHIQKMVHEAIVETPFENLFFLPSGPSAIKPVEFLNSRRMSFLLSYLKRRFDVLVIDSSPILPASDALVLAPWAEEVVLVVKAGQVNRKLVRRVVDQIQMTKAKVIGVALNQVDTKREGYYKYYYKYYSQYYVETSQKPS